MRRIPTPQERPVAGDGLAPWDGTLPRSLLSSYDLRSAAYGISNALHYCTGIPYCQSGQGAALCAMCGNAMRLVVQNVEPRLRDAFLKRTASAVGLPNVDLHPTYRGDD